MLKKFNKYKYAYLFISPFYILFAIFGIYPIIYSLYLSFNSFKGMGPITFVGFKNYINLFSDTVFFAAIKNTLYIWIIYISLVLIFAIILASIFNLGYIKLKGLFRTIYFIPIVTSTVAVSLVFLIIFQNERGLLNFILSKINISNINWLNSYEWSKPAIIITMLWRWTGYNIILILAGLQSINEDLYEAARIDGASTFNIFFKITLPLLRPMITFCAVVGTIDVFQQFTEPYILTQGGPGVATTTLGLYLYNVAFKYSKLGYGSSMAYIITFFVLLASIVQIRLLNRE